MYVKTLYCPMAPYGVMIIVNAYGNLYGDFNTRHYTLVATGFLLILAVSYGL